MNLKPILHAVGAGLYISLIVLIVQMVDSLVKPEGTLVGPMLFLSLFVLSAAVMGFLFLYEPFRLFMEGQKKEAVTFFLTTLGSFAVLAVFYLVVLIYSSPSI